MLYLELALAGLSVGSIAALAGIGLLITYRATGVLNLAHGGIATLIAFSYWQLATGWHWPVAAAAVVAVGGFAPALGYLLDRAVFRPLARRQASASESLVATLGVLLVILGSVSFVWGFQTRTDVPSIVPTGRVGLGGSVSIAAQTLATFAVLVAVCAAILALTRWTRFGVQARAVVDQRELAELSLVNADRVSAAAWMAGAGFAGLTGVLLAPLYQLNTFNLTLLVVETIAVPVIARFASLGTAVLAALVLGVGESLLTQVSFSGVLGFVVSNLKVHLFVVALLGVLVIRPRLREVGIGARSRRGFTSTTIGSASRPSKALPAAGLLTALAALVIPLAIGGELADRASAVVALSVIFLSIVVITGYSGTLALGQSGFAGIGAISYALIESGKIPGLPVLPGVMATLLATAAAATVGGLVGWPALRQRGLTLGLLTLAVALTLYETVFQNPALTKGLRVPRPEFLHSSRAFYLHTCGYLVVTLYLARNLRSGRLGRALGAMRDSPEGAGAVGLSLVRYQLFILTVSAGLAGLGGALLAQANRAFDPTTFLPLYGLFWFTTVVVAGAGSALAAVLAAAAVFAIDTSVGQPGASTIVFGIGALVVLPRSQGGIAGLLGAVARLDPSSRRSLVGARRAPASAPLGALRLSARGRAVRSTYLAPRSERSQT